jgi:hypothetical protein
MLVLMIKSDVDFIDKTADIVSLSAPQPSKGERIKMSTRGGGVNSQT